MKVIFIVWFDHYFSFKFFLIKFFIRETAKFSKAAFYHRNNS